MKERCFSKLAPTCCQWAATLITSHKNLCNPSSLSPSLPLCVTAKTDVDDDKMIQLNFDFDFELFNDNEND